MVSEVKVLVTIQEAREIRDALNRLAQQEAQEQQTHRDSLIQASKDWWNTIKPKVPNTRDEALIAFRYIEKLKKTERDNYRYSLLSKKLDEANEKYMELKALG